MADDWTVLDMLEQGDWWRSAKGWQRVEYMSPDHKRNLLRWLERRAASLHDQHVMNGYWALSRVGGEAAYESIENELEQAEHTAPEKWLREQELVIALNAEIQQDNRDQRNWEETQQAGREWPRPAPETNGKPVVWKREPNQHWPPGQFRYGWEWRCENHKYPIQGSSIRGWAQCVANALRHFRRYHSEEEWI